MRKLLFAWVVVAGCQKADPETSAAPAPKAAPAPAVAFAEPPPAPTPPPPAPTPPPAPPTPPAKLEVKVELTAVTLADDCGGRAPVTAPAKAKAATKADSDEAYIAPDSKSYRESRRCEQTSMQLAISATATARIQIKSVELVDETGKSLGMLTASKPTRWTADTSRYAAWDETLAANTPVSASYVLSQPNWLTIGNRWNRTFTLKAVVSIGGTNRSVNKQITLRAPTVISQPVKT